MLAEPFTKFRKNPCAFIPTDLRIQIVHARVFSVRARVWGFVKPCKLVDYVFVIFAESAARGDAPPRSELFKGRRCLKRPGRDAQCAHFVNFFPSLSVSPSFLLSGDQKSGVYAQPYLSTPPARKSRVLRRLQYTSCIDEHLPRC